MPRCGTAGIVRSCEDRMYGLLQLSARYPKKVSTFITPFPSEGREPDARNTFNSY